MSMAVAAMVETKRRNTAIREGLEDKHGGVVSISAMWLVPQYNLIGLAEALNAIGQIKFYYSQFPKSMSSIGVALYSLGILIVTLVDRFNERGGHHNYLSQGRYDYYYWLVAAISGVVLKLL